MKFPEREEGQGLVEYALVLVLVAVVVIAILTILGPQIVLVFARVAGGLNGDVIDVASGDQAVVLSYDGTVTESGGSCSANISNIRYVGVDNNGQIITNATVPATIIVDGIERGSLSATANGSGIATGGGGSYTGSCPFQMSLE